MDMARNKLSFIILILIGLSILGLFSVLSGDTLRVLINFLVVIGVSLTIFAVIYFVFLKNQQTNDDMKKYKQAVKQSKAKYGSKQDYKRAVSVKHSDKKKRMRRGAHLRVIEGGHKENKKDRAIPK